MRAKTMINQNLFLGWKNSDYAAFGVFPYAENLSTHHRIVLRFRALALSYGVHGSLRHNSFNRRERTMLTSYLDTCWMYEGASAEQYTWKLLKRCGCDSRVKRINTASTCKAERFYWRVLLTNRKGLTIFTKIHRVKIKLIPHMFLRHSECLSIVMWFLLRLHLTWL
jgi:hypothetical protein